MKRPFNVWWLTAGIFLMLIACMVILVVRHILAQDPAPAIPKLANVEVLTLAAQAFNETLELPARVVADRSVRLSAETAGRLDEWLVEEGQEVDHGQVLARINSDELQAQLGEAKARVKAGASQVRAAEAALTQSRTAVKTARLGLAAAESDLEFQRKEYKRIKELFDQTVVPEASLDGALNDLNQARLRQEQALEAVTNSEQQVASAQAALALAENQREQGEKTVELLQVQLEKTRIKAPFAGRVDKHLVETGGLVAPGTRLIDLFDLKHIRAVVDVADRYVPFLEQGNGAVEQYLQLTLPGAKQKISSSIVLPGMPKLTGGTYAGVELPTDIVRVAQASDPISNTFEVELRVRNPGGALKQGILVHARLTFLVYPEALVVPLPALSVTDAGTRVLVAEGGNGSSVARVRAVTPLSIHGDKVLIRGNVTPGDHIIIAGGKGVVDGERVNVLVVDGELVPGNSAGSEEE